MGKLKNEHTLNLKEGQADDNGEIIYPQFGNIASGTNMMLPLPTSQDVDPNIGVNACKWLDDYIAFSRLWSPRAYEGFHIACGLWILSAVASRRTYVNLGKKRYTNLYFALIARTSLFAKSSTADIAIQTIKDAGLSKLLVSDNTTPQKFLADMASSSKDISTVDGIPVQPNLGQRAWFYEEFGQHVSAMMKNGGYMSDFLHILKRFDDTPDDYKYGTMKGGTVTVDKPYLSLLANLTPDDIKPFVGRGSRLWGDGFLARFALICPPEGIERSKELFPRGKRQIPSNILDPLIKWNNRLGSISNPTTRLRMTRQVYEAYHEYDNSLIDLLAYSTIHDLDGNYSRLPEKALRIATLIASISGDEFIRLKHWYRAQEITEQWRADLHEVYRQVSMAKTTNTGLTVREKILSLAYKLNGCTINDIHRYMKNISDDTVMLVINQLVEDGDLSIQFTRKNTDKYVLPTKER